jgi:hypothetical protein
MKKVFLFFTVICFCCAVQAQTANDYQNGAEEGVVKAQYSIAKALDEVTSTGINLDIKPNGNTVLYQYEKALKNGLDKYEKVESENVIEKLKAAGYSSSKKIDIGAMSIWEKRKLYPPSFIFRDVPSYLLSGLFGIKKENYTHFYYPSSYETE